MKLGKYDVTPKSMQSFLVGNVKMYADKIGIVKLPKHEEEQVLLRMLLCSDCNELGECKICSCQTPNMFFDPNKIDGSGKWGPMMDKIQWNDFMAKVTRSTTKNDKPIESLDDLPDKKLKKVINVYRQYYTENEDMLYSIEPEIRERDLGQLEYNTNTGTQFEVTNTLSFPVQITKILSGCGCTIPSWPTDKLEAGSTFTINLRFEGRSLGRFRKSINVIYDDPRILATNLTVYGSVVVKGDMISDTEPPTDEALFTVFDLSNNQRNNLEALNKSNNNEPIA